MNWECYTQIKNLPLCSQPDADNQQCLEGTISQGVGRFGLRRTRYFGLTKTHLQHIATACAINLSRFFACSNHVTKARTRISSFARLGVNFT